MQAWLDANEGEIPTDDEDDFSEDENDSANESMDDDDPQAEVEVNEPILVGENVELVVDVVEDVGPVEPDFENFDNGKFDEQLKIFIYFAAKTFK